MARQVTCHQSSGLLTCGLQKADEPKSGPSNQHFFNSTFKNVATDNCARSVLGIEGNSNLRFDITILQEIDHDFGR